MKIQSSEGERDNEGKHKYQHGVIHFHEKSQRHNSGSECRRANRVTRVCKAGKKKRVSFWKFCAVHRETRRQALEQECQALTGHNGKPLP